MVSLRGSSQRATELFTLNDFDTGRVSYPSQNLANGPPPLPASLGGSEHAHVMWAKKNGYRPFNGGQKLFSIHDFDSGRVSFPEEGLRGVHAVVKSTDTNIDPAGTGSDHIWQHQMSHGPVPGEQWPLEMPGFKARTMQLRVLTNDKSKVGKKQMALSSKLDKLQLQVRRSDDFRMRSADTTGSLFTTIASAVSGEKPYHSRLRTHKQIAGGAVAGKGGERAGGRSDANAEQHTHTQAPRCKHHGAQAPRWHAAQRRLQAQ